MQKNEISELNIVFPKQPKDPICGEKAIASSTKM